MDDEKAREELQRIIWKWGRQEDLAEELGVSQVAVSKWLRFGIPPHRAIQLEMLTGVKRERLRPDMFLKRRRGE